MTKEGFGKLASLTEAFDIINSIVRKTGKESVALDEANNRILAQDVIARVDVPHFAKSAMDGYAVIANDTFGASNTAPKRLKIVESVTAGVVPKRTVEPGTCIGITTGAPMPKGADAVLMVEYTEKEGDELVFYKACAPSEQVIRAGSDVKKGSLMFAAGTLLNPRFIGAIASQGIAELKAAKAPVIAYFSTGNEIVVSGELSIGRVYDINSRTVVDTLREHGCSVKELGVVRDSIADIKKTITENLDADIVLLSGGSSLGGEDFMVEAVQSLGEVLVHGIASKPGKPVLIGRVEGKLVLGLPGYPTSALSNTYSLVLPVVYSMMGGEYRRAVARAVLSRKIASTIGRYEFMPVKLEDGMAVPVMKGSSSITTMSEADGYIEIDENTEVVNKGREVGVKLF